MNLKEIMMTVNSDITKPLNNLISELSDEQVVLLNNVLDKLNNISTGGGTGSSGNKPFYTSGFEKDIIDINPSVSTLPYKFSQGSAVVYNNEIHILGDIDSSYYTAHYKWNGTSWTSVSTLPYNFYQGSAVVLYNNEIHILGGSGNSTAHYKLTKKSLYKIYLPYGSIIYFYDNRILSITEKTNCTKQSDNSILVNSNGLVEFEIVNSIRSNEEDDIKYSIF